MLIKYFFVNKFKNTSFERKIIFSLIKKKYFFFMRKNTSFDRKIIKIFLYLKN
jgi:hypothetical protein